MRLCYLLAYKAPDYIRTRNLVQALQSMDGVELRVAKNRSTGPARYLETLKEAFHIERTWRPDYYLVGFRGHELYPLLRSFLPGKRIIFDNMMSPTLSLLEERGLGRARKTLVSSTIERIEHWILRDAGAVLTDTNAHVDAFKEHFRLHDQNLAAVPVAAEETFRTAPPPSADKRTVLFYGSFLPLHGTTFILDALRRMSLPGVTFHFVGGSDSDGSDIARLRNENPGIEIRHDRHIPFDTLIGKHLAQAWLCLGGPFGGTPQAKRVITGKTAQALAMAVPTMIGESPAARGLIDRKNCLVVTQRDPVGIANSIEWAYHNPTALAEIGNAGQAFYREHLSMDRVKDSLGSLLRRLS